MKAGLKSWKSTALGITLGLITLLLQATSWLDEDETTRIDWNIVAGAVQSVGLIIFGLIVRDADKSSEASGVK